MRDEHDAVTRACFNGPVTAAPGVDLVCVNYRTPYELAQFLASVDNYPPAGEWTIKVINVDPQPADHETAESWCDQRHNALHAVFHENVGYARACNRGAAMGDLEYVALFNADVRLLESAVDRCVKALDDNPEWGVLGPRQVNEHGQLTAAGIIGPPTKPQHRAWLHDDNPDLYGDILDDVPMVAGSALFVSRFVWDQLTICADAQRAWPAAEGAMGLSPLFYEDAWLARHAAAHGYRNVFYGPVKIVHGHHKSVRANNLEHQVLGKMETALAQFRQACTVHGGMEFE